MTIWNGLSSHNDYPISLWLIKNLCQVMLSSTERKDTIWIKNPQQHLFLCVNRMSRIKNRKNNFILTLTVQLIKNPLQLSRDFMSISRIEKNGDNCCSITIGWAKIYPKVKNFLQLQQLHFSIILVVKRSW